MPILNNGASVHLWQAGCGLNLEVLQGVLLDQERGHPDHGQPPDVHLDVVEVGLVSVGSQQVERIEAQVSRAAVTIVLDTQEVAVILLVLQVVLCQRLEPDSDCEHRALHLVEAQGAVQIIRGVQHTHLAQDGTAVGLFEEDGQEGRHCKPAVLHLGFTVVVVRRLRDGAGRRVEGAPADSQVQGVEAKIRVLEPRVGEIPVALGHCEGGRPP
mmetsp:Transcript_9706/g.12756  ORF Transcript_9706/g.12756 Transcript_9706/m.12756 type:complete len:213 (+) Transcript_9706:123-761(+)